MSPTRFTAPTFRTRSSPATITVFRTRHRRLQQGFFSPLVITIFFPKRNIYLRNLLWASSIYPPYFPRGPDIVCAEDPEWDRYLLAHFSSFRALPPTYLPLISFFRGLKGSGLQPPRLSLRCVQGEQRSNDPISLMTLNEKKWSCWCHLPFTATCNLKSNKVIPLLEMTPKKSAKLS